MRTRGPVKRWHHMSRVTQREPHWQDLNPGCLDPKLTTMWFAVSRPRPKSLLCAPPTPSSATLHWHLPVSYPHFWDRIPVQRFSGYRRNSTMLDINHCVSLYLPLCVSIPPTACLWSPRCLQTKRVMLSDTGRVGTTQRDKWETFLSVQQLIPCHLWN